MVKNVEVKTQGIIARNEVQISSGEERGETDVFEG